MYILCIEIEIQYTFQYFTLGVKSMFYDIQFSLLRPH